MGQGAPPSHDASAKSGSLGKSQAANLILLAATTLIGLSCGEAILRYCFPMGGVIYQRDARYLFRYIPYSRKQHTPLREGPRYGYSRLVTINAEGRIGPALSPGKRRIVVFGDSFVASESTPFASSFCTQLEKSLGARLTHPIQVINAGVSGYGPDQESLVMEDQLAAIAPELVVVALYSGNDFGDLLRNKLYALDSGGQLLRQYPVLSSSLDYEFAEAEAQPRLQIVRRLRKLSDNLRSSALAREVKGFLFRNPRLQQDPPRVSYKQRDSTRTLRYWLSQREEEYRSAVVSRDPFVYNLFKDDYDADIALEPTSASAQYKIGLMDGVIGRMGNLAAARSVPILFVIIPAAIDAMDWDITVNPALFPRYRRSALTDALESMIRRRNLSYVNLFSPFRERQPSELYYRVTDDHWSPAGQQLAARIVTDYILTHHLLAGNSPGTG